MSRRYVLTLSISILFVTSFGIAVASDADIVINEIMYNPIGNEATDEYVELYNAGPDSVDVGDWTITDNSATDTLSGWNGGTTVIPSWGYAVITDTDTAVVVPGNAVHLSCGNATIGNGLLNDGDELTLKDDSPATIDTVVFDDAWGANNTGSSLELIDPSSDNNVQANWNASDPPANHGTPGVRNSQVETNAPANVTNFLVVFASITSLNLKWTNPADADFSGTLILRRKDNAPTGTPTDGTAYNIDDTIGDGTVVYNDAQDRSVNPFTDTGLDNNSVYYYKAFAYDEVLNYAGGVQDMGSTSPPVPLLTPVGIIIFALVLVLIGVIRLRKQAGGAQG